MSASIEETIQADALWVLVQIRDSICALDSTCVEAISLLEDEITKMPNSDETNVGVIQFRDSVLPIVDLRRVMGMISQAQEQQDFDHMLDVRKQDHVNWVDELKRCTQEHCDFHLATDPHNCAFGRWYYNYRPTSHELAFHLKKLEEPHKLLHESAISVLSSLKDTQDGAARAATIISRETNAYKAQVLRLLDETKAAFKNSYRKMFVVVSDGKTTCGLLVDEVLAVETLNNIDSDKQPSCVDATALVSQVAQRQSNQELVMLLNHQQLLSTLPQDEALRIS